MLHLHIHHSSKVWNEVRGHCRDEQRNASKMDSCFPLVSLLFRFAFTIAKVGFRITVDILSISKVEEDRNVLMNHNYV